MKTINRFAAVVTPAQPFMAWSESVLDKEANLCDKNDFRTIFLLKERDEIEKALQSAYPAIFEVMLYSSVNDPDCWPDNRDLQTFRKWFEVQLVEMVYDTEGNDLMLDAL